ncbi:aldo/keto reductase [Pseudonocardia sp. GCM10023141]|uniref:aldo/keto reductase n=1 Tax=Pseudonocardia sp. GCM10023141 TaxID=3252653 RepID=UPI00361EA934
MAPVDVPLRLVLGTVAFGTTAEPAAATAIVEGFLARGGRWIDTAAAYGDGATEIAVGKVLDELGCRDDVVLATKFGLTPPGPGVDVRAFVIDEVEGSLRRLGTDRVDLLQMHRPWFDVEPEPVLQALGRLVEQGKVARVGASNFPSWVLQDHLRAAAAGGLPAMVSQQSPYNLLDRRIENETLPFCRLHDVALLTWSPTASGMLSGRYAHGTAPPPDSRASVVPGFTERLTRENLAVVAALAALAAEVGLSVAQLGLAWTLARDGVAGVVIGPRTLDHLADSLGVLDHTGGLPPDAAIDRVVVPGGRVIDFATLSRPLSRPQGASS